MTPLPIHLAHPHGIAPVGNVARTPRHAEAELRHHTARLGMWIFLASEVLFFGALIVAYAIARFHSPEGKSRALLAPIRQDWQRHNEHLCFWCARIRRRGQCPRAGS